MTRAHLESDLQQAVAQLLGFYETRGDLVWFPIPNGMQIAGDAQQRARRMATLKAKGQLRPGVLDIGIILPGGIFRMIELKIGSNDTTPNQDRFIEALGRVRCEHVVCRSVDEAKRIIDHWRASVRKAAA